MEILSKQTKYCDFYTHDLENTSTSNINYFRNEHWLLRTEILNNITNTKSVTIIVNDTNNYVAYYFNLFKSWDWYDIELSNTMI